jgi:probable rRNA maturation factor
VSAHAATVEIAVSGVTPPRWKAGARRFCRAAVAAAGFDGGEISLLLCGDERIAELNARYRGKNRPTDVLSFPREEPGKSTAVAGDIAISLPALGRNARTFGVHENEELKRLLVHGILHLAGMDHGRGKGAAMLSLQEVILARLDAERIIGE